MFEAMVMGKYGEKSDNTGKPAVVVGAHLLLLSGICKVGNTVYSYGGITNDGSNRNALWYYTGDGQTTSWVAVSDIALGVVIVYPKLLRWGNKLCIFGSTEQNQLAVKVIDFQAKTATTYNTGVITSGAITAAAIDANGIAYVKKSASGAIAKINLNNGTTELFTTLTGSGVPTEGMLISGDDLFLMGGWYSGAHNTAVWRVKLSTKAQSLWDTLASTTQGTVNQGIVSVGNIFHYLSWNNGASLVYQHYNPVTKTKSDTTLLTGITYRNAPAIGSDSRGIMYGGGTTTPLGNANWTTANRQSQLYSIEIPGYGFDTL